MAPLFKGIPTVPDVFLEPPDVSGLRSCTRNHLKRPYAVLGCWVRRVTNNLNNLTVSDGGGNSVKAAWRVCRGGPAFASRSWPSSSLKEPSSQALTLFEMGRFVAWRLRCLFLWECWRGLGHFWSCWACLGYGPPSESTFKKAVCWILPFGGAHDKSLKYAS